MAEPLPLLPERPDVPRAEVEEDEAPALPSDIEPLFPPAETSPNDLDSIFGEEPERGEQPVPAPRLQQPAQPPTEEPAEEPTDDIFDGLFDPSPAQPDVVPPAPQAEPQTEEEPPTSIDDLLNELGTDQDASGSRPAGAPPESAPDAAPQQESSGDLDDLFETNPQPDANPPQGAPAPEELPDIFGASPDRPAGSEVPIQPDNQMDDLLGEPDENTGDEPALPQSEMPDDELNLDDLFNDPAPNDSTSAPSPPALEPETHVDATQPQASPASQPERQDAGEPIASASLALPTENLPVQQVVWSHSESSPSETPATAEKKTISDSAISAVQRMTDSAELPMRHWTDNTGIYHAHGRLVLIGDDFVRLLKDNGRHATVPLRRLSQADLQYVMAEATRQGISPIGEVAGR